MKILFMVLLLATAIVLVLIILVQRGKGGGLAGALGGLGGQSAFGTKAGDLFTKVTIGVAGFWILLCVLSAMGLKKEARRTDVGGPAVPVQQSSSSQPSTDTGGTPAPSKSGS
jgi:preprotein translocase subunit SecG